MSSRKPAVTLNAPGPAGNEAFARASTEIAEAALFVPLTDEQSSRLATALSALRGLAPVRPRTAGFAAGLFAGALGALGYSLACPELAASFVAVWYTLGIGLVALAGAALAPFVLRW